MFKTSCYVTLYIMDLTFIAALADVIERGCDMECKSIVRRYRGDTYKLLCMVYYGYYSLTTRGVYNVIESRNIDSILNCLYKEGKRNVVIDMYDGCRAHPTIIYLNRRFKDTNRQLLSSIRKKHYNNIGVHSYKFMNKFGPDALFNNVVEYFTGTIGCTDSDAVHDIWIHRSLSDDFDMNLIRILSIIAELLLL